MTSPLLPLVQSLARLESDAAKVTMLENWLAQRAYVTEPDVVKLQAELAELQKDLDMLHGRPFSRRAFAALDDRADKAEAELAEVRGRLQEAEVAKKNYLGDLRRLGAYFEKELASMVSRDVALRAMECWATELLPSIDGTSAITEHIDAQSCLAAAEREISSQGSSERATYHAARLDKLIGPDRAPFREWTTLVGILDTASVRGGGKFEIKDRLNGSIIKCEFDREEKLDEVRHGLACRVEISGVAEFNADSEPTFMRVETIKTLDQPNLATVEDLSDIDFTGGQDHADYITGLRDDE